jgi:Spx/MgsR family transcriptional regulator
MSMVLYGLENCSTCKKARAWLESKGINYEFVDYRKKPLANEWLSAWAKDRGGWEKIINRAGMTWRHLSEEKKNPTTDAAWQNLIKEYPALTRRPLVVSGKKLVAIGFSEKDWASAGFYGDV